MLEKGSCSAPVRLAPLLAVPRRIMFTCIRRSTVHYHDGNAFTLAVYNACNNIPTWVTQACPTRGHRALIISAREQSTYVIEAICGKARCSDRTIFF